MAAGTQDTVRDARARRIAGVLLAIASAIAVVALAVVVEQSQERARGDAIARFEERGAIIARTLSGDVQQELASTAAESGPALSGDVDEADLRSTEGGGDSSTPYTAVLTAQGTLLAAHPSDAPIGSEPASRDAIDAAGEGEATVTDVIDHDTGEVLEFVVPITTTDGDQRIFVVAYPVEAIASNVAGAITEAVNSDEGAAFIVDTNGAGVLAVGNVSLRRRLGPVVHDAVDAGRESGLSRGVRYVVEPLEGTSLRYAYALPEREVLRGLPSTTWPRLAIVGLALALLAVFALASRAMRDARRLDAARREADEANLAKGELLAHVSHELKTPIAVIRGFAGLLHRADLGERDQGYVDHIDESGQHLFRLADDLLEASRVEAGRLTLALEHVDPTEVVDEILELATPLADARRITLAQRPPQVPVPAVVADQMRLRQVLLNLLSNAIKYNHEGGDVYVSVQSSAGVVTIAVEDTGPGIAPEDVGRLFQPFERLTATRGGVRGTGLGLFVTRGIVEAMGGSISVSSVPGTGSIFTFTLPASRAADTASHVAHPDSVEPASSGRIVYIDDNGASLELVERIVGDSRPGLVVQTAGDGTTGIELVRARGTDLLLLDLNLPDMHGEAVLELLRADPATAALPVLIVSADSTSRDISRLLDAGADAYLTKPLDDVQFLEVVDRLLLATRK